MYFKLMNVRSYEVRVQWYPWYWYLGPCLCCVNSEYQVQVPYSTRYLCTVPVMRVLYVMMNDDEDSKIIQSVSDEAYLVQYLVRVVRTYTTSYQQVVLVPIYLLGTRVVAALRVVEMISFSISFILSFFSILPTS